MKIKTFVLVIVFALISLAACSSKTNQVDLTGFNMETQNAIKDLVKQYGKDTADYKNNAYMVSDFDNTTSIFDITYQCTVYQLQTMSFNLSVDEIRDVLATSLEEDETIADYLDDISASYKKLVETYGEFTARGLRDEQLSTLQNDNYWKEFATKMKCLYYYVEDTVSDELSCEWIMYWYTNMTEEEVYDLFKRSCLKYQNEDTTEIVWRSPSEINSKSGVVECSFLLGCSVTQSVKNMLEYYVKNGIDTWICSASHVDGVRAAVDAFGLSDCITGVIGMTQKTINGKFIPEYDYETGYPYKNMGKGNWEKTDTPIESLPCRKGKVEAVKNALCTRYNVGPIAGFMDASGDFNFCTEFSSMKMVICYNRANRKITEGAGLIAIAAMYQKDKGINLKTANENGDTYYLLQGRNENGKRTLRESNSTIQYGKTDEKLFANEDNYTLFSYLKEKNLSLKQFFDTFAIKTSQEQSVLGVGYGHLNTYDGYHNC